MSPEGRYRRGDWPGRVVRAARRALRGGSGPRRRAADPFEKLRQLDGPELTPIPTIVREDRAGRRRRLVVLLPSLLPDRLTGGPNTALQIGARVAERGVPVTFAATQGLAADDDRLREHLRTLVGGSGAAADMTFASVADPEHPLRIAPGDVPMATWWPTAYAAARALEVAGGDAFLYLIQDFEPAFYAWSTNYALALATYSMPMRPIFNTALLREHFVANHIGRLTRRSADHSSIAFEPAVDTTLFRPGPDGGAPRLLVYARPSKPRNAFDLALRSLRVAVERGDFEPGWEFWSIGAQVPELPLGRGLTLRPMPWRSLTEYGALLGSSNVLLSLMLSPHTSYPPLEMAAAGGTVVTNTFGVKTAAALQRLSPRIIAAEPNVDALATAIATAARTPRASEPATLALPTSWAASLQPVVDWVLDVGFGVRAGPTHD